MGRRRTGSEVNVGRNVDVLRQEVKVLGVLADDNVAVIEAHSFPARQNRVVSRDKEGHDTLDDGLAGRKVWRSISSHRLLHYSDR